MDRYTDYDPFADAYNRHWGALATRVLPVLDRLILRHLTDGSVLLDLCCGAGQLAAALGDRGYRVIGVDGSEAMIGHARRNAPASEFVVADARSFTLPGPVDAAISTFDSLNHLMTLSDLTRAFRCVSAVLAPAAPFLFDLNMEEGFRSRWQGSFGIVSDDEVIVARSQFDAGEGIGRMDFTILSPDGDRWQREDLALTQRCFSEREVTTALTEAGLGDVEVFDARDLDIDEEGRSFFLCRSG